MTRSKDVRDQDETAAAPITTTLFGALDRETIAHYCDVEMAKVRLQQQQLDHEARERDEARLRADRDSEPRLLVENARARAEAQKIADTSALDRAKVELEIRKLRVEGQRLEAEMVIGITVKAAEALWPKVEQFGAGIMRMHLEQVELLRSEMHLIAGRNPRDGSK